MAHDLLLSGVCADMLRRCGGASFVLRWPLGARRKMAARVGGNGTMNDRGVSLINLRAVNPQLSQAVVDSLQIGVSEFLLRNSCLTHHPLNRDVDRPERNQPRYVEQRRFDGVSFV